MSADLSGRTLGQFVVLDKLGEGGFGTVYRAKQALLDRPAVIKVLHSRLRATAMVTERFLREARLASQLDHPYAAHIYAFGAEPDGMLWLAMELVRGTTLSEYLRENGALPLERFVPLLERICEVLHTAHEAGIVHRDIKPDNVMVVSRAGRLLPKLLDFGIAKAMLEEPGAERSPLSSSTLPKFPDLVLGNSDTVQTGMPIDTEIPPTGGLTQRGAVMGSPHYMAPEQWVNAADVDRRTDIYAVGVVAFEALTGTLPFNGKTLLDLARAHAASYIPSVPDSLPDALNRVFARAFARTPSERFQTALELAAEFRSAAGLADEPAPLPQLDEEIRHRFLSDAPQPLADAVAALDSARGARQARDAVWLCVSALTRYLGVLALAARSRFAGTREGPVALSALRRIGTELLTDDDWLAIVHALARAHAGRPDVHPVPELVLFFFTASGEPGPGATRLRELAALRDELADAAAGDAAMRERLGKALVILSALLRDAEFVCDYSLVVPLGDGMAERWVGPRRSHRALQRIVGNATAGSATLVDSSGVPALSLAPLVQVRAPTPGAEPEVFVYAGRDERGGKLVASPFEWHDEHVIDWLRAQMITTLESAEPGTIDESGPYRGLEAFTADDANMFFGREQLVDAFVNRLRLQPLIAVVGASGAGKSSFVQAGVVPALGDAWRAIILRPGPSPMTALASRLTAAGIAGAEHAGPERIGELVRADAAARGPLLVVVDQLEELFTLSRDETDRSRFAASLVAAARDAETPVRIVLTLRDDFLVRAESLPELRERLAQGLQLLGVPGREDLERILIEPARRVGYEFEDPELVTRMVSEVADQPGALALLSFTAARLWEHRDRHFRRLPTRAYDEIGGVGGALAQHADALLETMTREERRLVREAFRNLVTSEGTRAVLARRDLSSVLGDTPTAHAVIERLVASRLLVAGEGEGDERIEIAHEALLDAWPRLVEWRREDAEGARLRDQLRAAAKQWQDRGRARGLLWRDDALAEYKLWRQRYPGALAAVEEAFAGASLRDAARGRRLRRGALVAAFAILSIGMLVLLQLNRRAETARALADDSAQEAHQRVLDLRVEQGRQALLARDPMRALVYFSNAYSSGANGVDLKFMIGRASAQLDTQLHVLLHGSPVRGLALSRNDKLVASSGGHAAIVWDLESGRRLHTFESAATVWAVDFSPDGKQLLTGGDDQTAKIWDVASGALVCTLPHSTRVRVARFSPDGRRVATASLDNNLVRLWDAQTGALLATMAAHTDFVKGVAFRGDGERLLSWSLDGTARVWSVPGGEPIATLAHQGWVIDADFSPDGSQVATGSFDRTAKIWDASGQLLKTLKHVDGVTGLRFSPDGKQLVTSTDDARATVWNVASGDPVQKLVGHTDSVFGVRFSSDGRRVLSYAADATARLWDVESGTEMLMFAGHSQQVWSAEISSTGDRVVTASLDGTLAIWNARAVEARSSTIGDPDELVAWTDSAGLPAAAVPGDRVLIASAAGAPKIRSLHDGSVVKRFAIPGPPVRALWNPDGQHVIALAPDDARIWEVQTGSSSALHGTGGAYDAAFTNDGTRVALGFRDRPVEIWQLAPKRRIATLPGTILATTIAFSPDGTRLATALDPSGTQLWDASTGALLATLVGHTGHVLDIAWSADGRSLITAGGDDKTARIWDRDGRPLAVLEGSSGVVSGAALDTTGSLAATASDDTTARVWSVANSTVLATYPAQASVGWVGFSSDDRQLLVVTADATRKTPPMFTSWSVARDSRTAEQLATYARCRIPLTFQGERVIPAATLCK